MMINSSGTTKVWNQAASDRSPDDIKSALYYGPHHDVTPELLGVLLPPMKEMMTPNNCDETRRGPRIVRHERSETVTRNTSFHVYADDDDCDDNVSNSNVEETPHQYSSFSTPLESYPEIQHSTSNCENSSNTALRRTPYENNNKPHTPHLNMSSYSRTADDGSNSIISKKTKARSTKGTETPAGLKPRQVDRLRSKIHSALTSDCSSVTSIASAMEGRSHNTYNNNSRRVKKNGNGNANNVSSWSDCGNGGEEDDSKSIKSANTYAGNTRYSSSLYGSHGNDYSQPNIWRNQPQHQRKPFMNMLPENNGMDRRSFPLQSYRPEPQESMTTSHDAVLPAPVTPSRHHGRGYGYGHGQLAEVYPNSLSPTSSQGNYVSPTHYTYQEHSSSMKLSDALSSLTATALHEPHTPVLTRSGVKTAVGAMVVNSMPAKATSLPPPLESHDEDDANRDLPYSNSYDNDSNSRRKREGVIGNRINSSDDGNSSIGSWYQYSTSSSSTYSQPLSHSRQSSNSVARSQHSSQLNSSRSHSSSHQEHTHQKHHSPMSYRSKGSSDRSSYNGSQHSREYGNKNRRQSHNNSISAGSPVSSDASSRRKRHSNLKGGNCNNKMVRDSRDATSSSTRRGAKTKNSTLWNRDFDVEYVPLTAVGRVIQQIALDESANGGFARLRETNARDRN
uniref:Uncharacterized protein n=1 Tax=Chaetoceros debilis TaxID=122233 RepID=A0A7S3QGL2_9STRA